MFLLIDNYDSFVYNLYRYFEELNQNVSLYRNDEITIEQIRNMKLKGIIISPGPKTPRESGLSLDIINTFKGLVPILGVCLGHQSIAYAFGSHVIRGRLPMHGKISEVSHDGCGVFKGIKNPLNVTRYHSLIVERETLPNCFTITCESEDGTIMGIRHKEYKLEGVQFHPEAELTESGHAILANFINICTEP